MSPFFRFPHFRCPRIRYYRLLSNFVQNFSTYTWVYTTLRKFFEVMKHYHYECQRNFNWRKAFWRDKRAIKKMSKTFLWHSMTFSDIVLYLNYRINFKLENCLKQRSENLNFSSNFSQTDQFLRKKIELIRCPWHKKSYKVHLSDRSSNTRHYGRRVGKLSPGLNLTKLLDA